MTDLIDTPPAPAPMPIWLERERPVFGVYQPPATPRHPLAVLFCAPFGWEDMGSYPVRRQWAQQLARAGHAVLRFDLPGTGQSAGEPHDEGLVAQWIAATADAARWLRDQDDTAAVAAVGIGLGALLALHAAAEGAPIDELVLWGLPTGGRTLVRRMRAFAGLQADATDHNDHPLPAGSLETGGFVLSASTMADLSHLEVNRTPAPRLRRALLLEGVTPDGEASAATALQAAGVQVRVERAQGYAMMLDSPHLAEFPATTVDRTVEWLNAPCRPSSAPASPAVTARAECVLEHDGVTIRERPFWVASHGAMMFGILAVPVDAVTSTGTCLVCLPAMAERCIGPSRLWVELARRHAARGIPSLRIDLLAVGDSDGDPNLMHSYRTVFDAKRIEQVRLVLNALQEREVGSSFTVAGLCSGGYWALNTAWIDQRIHNLLVLNPAVSAQGHAFIMRDAASRPLRMLLRVSTWQRVRSGEVSVSGGAREALRGLRFLLAGSHRVSPALESAAITDPRHEEPALEEAALNDPALLQATEADLAPSYRELLGRIRQRGGRIAVCVSRIEPGHRLLEIEGLLDTPMPGLIVSARDSHDHNLRAYADQRDVHSLADRLLGPAEGVADTSAGSLAPLNV